MAVEILILALGGVWLLVHIFAADGAATRQYGSRWNVSARDEDVPPLNKVAARLVRAQENYKETLPLAIIALFGVVLGGQTSDSTALGGWIWLGARIVYLPLYAFGVPVVRTLVYLVSMVGLGMIIWPLLATAPALLAGAAGA